MPKREYRTPEEVRAKDRLRNRRTREVRPRSIPGNRGSKRALQRGLELYPVEDHGRPTTRAGCQQVQRPCPFVSCRFNLYLDVSAKGSLKLNFPDLDPCDMAESCALDVADRMREPTLDRVADLMNLTRERIRQIEAGAMHTLTRRLGAYQ